jgi:phosphoribosylanthranilate isomerase
MIIKVCGLKHPANIRQAALIDIDWIGFIFYRKSPRFFSLDSKEVDCLTPATGRRPGRVGVFVNASTDEMIETARQYSLDYLQLHGAESPAVCQALGKRGYAVIKAFSVAAASDLAQTEEYAGKAAYFLFDTKSEGYGGSGKRFDWSLLSSYNGQTPFLLSGGITPGSLEDIRRLRRRRFGGIDLNSGFEREPGLKDMAKINDFIGEVRKFPPPIAPGDEAKISIG